MLDGDDKFLENKETIWRLHYNLVTNEDVTTWFWFFNNFKKQTFFVDWFAFVHFDQVSSSYYKIPVLLVKKTLYIYARLLPPIFFFFFSFPVLNTKHPIYLSLKYHKKIIKRIQIQNLYLII